MNDNILSLIENAQSAEIVTSYGADADTRVSPKVFTAVYRVLETILLYPMAQK